jgi:thioesterase domain-containing protein
MLYHDFAPKIFSGRITMVLAQDTFLTQRPDDDPRREWQAWAHHGVELIATPGDHVTFCREPLVAVLGRQIVLLMNAPEDTLSK